MARNRVSTFQKVPACGYISVCGRQTWGFGGTEALWTYQSECLWNRCISQLSLYDSNNNQLSLIGHKMCMPISKVLKAQSKAIQLALTAYNKAAMSLSPPHPNWLGPRSSNILPLPNLNSYALVLDRKFTTLNGPVQGTVRLRYVMSRYCMHGRKSPSSTLSSRG